MRALVTGVAGFVGSHLAERLVARGDEVRGIDRLSDYYSPELKRRNLQPLLDSELFDFTEDDLVEAELSPLLDSVDVVFHLAAQPGVRPSWGTEFSYYLRDNLLATQTLLEAAKGSQIRRLLLASSSSIYGDAMEYPTSEEQSPAPVSPYGVTKLGAEHLCRLYSKAFDVPTVVLRYFTIYGPRQRPDMGFSSFIEAAQRGEPITVFGDGRQTRDFTYVDDCVTATLAAAARAEPGSTYNIAGGSSASVLDVLDIVESLTGRPIDVQHLPAVPGDARHTSADTSRARQDLGFAPAVSLEAGLEAQLAAHRVVASVE